MNTTPIDKLRKGVSNHLQNYHDIRTDKSAPWFAFVNQIYATIGVEEIELHEVPMQQVGPELQKLFKIYEGYLLQLQTQLPSPPLASNEPALFVKTLKRNIISKPCLALLGTREAPSVPPPILRHFDSKQKLCGTPFNILLDWNCWHAFAYAARNLNGHSPEGAEATLLQGCFSKPDRQRMRNELTRLKESGTAKGGTHFGRCMLALLNWMEHPPGRKCEFSTANCQTNSCACVSSLTMNSDLCSVVKLHYPRLIKQLALRLQDRVDKQYPHALGSSCKHTILTGSIVPGYVWLYKKKRKDMWLLGLLALLSLLTVAAVVTFTISAAT